MKGMQAWGGGPGWRLKRGVKNKKGDRQRKRISRQTKTEKEKRAKDLRKVHS